MQNSPQLRSMFSSETHQHLIDWGQWARGNRILGNPTHPLARLVKRRLDDSARGYDYEHFPLDIEVTDKAVALLGMEDRRLKRIVVKFYLAFGSHIDIAHSLRLSEEMVKTLHVQAIVRMFRLREQVKRRLTGEHDGRIKTS